MRTPARILLLLCLVPGFVLAGCELLGDTSVPDYANVEEVRYGRHVQFLFEDRCTDCHDGSGAPAGLDLTSWNGVMAGSEFGEAVVPFSASRSRLWRMVASGTGGAHPAELGADTLTAIEVAFLRRWIEEGARDDAGETFPAHVAERILVAGTGEATVTVIDPVRMVVIRVFDLVELGFRADSAPSFVEASSNLSAIYVSLPGENAVLRLDGDGRPVGLADVTDPGPLSLSDDGSVLAVGRSFGEHTSIVTIETATMRPTERPVLFGRPQAVAVRPAGEGVLAVSQAADQVILIPLSGAPNQYLGLTGTRHIVDQMVISPDGRRAYATGRVSGQVLAFDLVPGSGMSVAGFGAAPGEPAQPSVSADGNLVFVPRRTAGAVSVLAASGLTPVRSITHAGLAEPQGSAYAAGRLFVSGRNLAGTWPTRRPFARTPGTVTVIDPATGEVVRVLEVPAEAAGMAVSGVN